MSNCTSILNSQQKEIEEASFKHNVSAELLKRFWKISSKWNGEKHHE